MKQPKGSAQEIDKRRALAKSNWLAKRPDEAEALYRQVLAMDSRDGPSLEGLGLIAAFRGDEKEALRLFERSYKFDPSRGTVQVNLIGSYLQDEDYEAARKMAEKVLARSSSNGLVHYLYGEALRGQGQFEAAAAQYDLAAAISGESAGQVESVIQERMGNCDWRSYELDTAWVTKRLRVGATLWQPMLPALVSGSPAELGRAARVFSDWKHPVQPPLHTGIATRRERIRLGYVTGEIYHHPVGHLMGGVLENYDRSKFELYGFSYSPVADEEIRSRVIPNFDHFFQMDGLDDESIARTIRQCDIDIAVILGGNARGSRPGIMSYRAAPIQVNYCGFPGTMGAPFIDYLVADRMVLPPEEAGAYVEKIAWMPDFYQATDDKALVAERTPTRAEEGLPENAFVFMGYNTTNKITPQVFDVWMRILRRVEGSVLWLAAKNLETNANLRREAQARGVDPNRLCFADPRDDRSVHIARHSLADLFLDTLPYNAHSTASDALWVGLPVITCEGTSFPGRVCAALLRAAGLPELVTHSHDDYEDLAVSLALDPARLAALTAKVKTEVRGSPLFDTAGYTRNLQTAFETMYETYQAGESPRSFAVDSGGRGVAGKPARLADRPAPAPPSMSAVPIPLGPATSPDVEAPSRTPADLAALGRAQWQAGRTEEAEATFTALRDIEPDNPVALEGLGLAAKLKGAGLLARTLLGQALEEDPTLVEAAINFAPFLRDTGLVKAALKVVEQALESHPDHALAHIVLGRLRWDAQDFPGAFEAFERAIDLDPTLSRVVDNWTYERLGACDWSGYTVQVEALTRMVRAGKDAAQPYSLMLMSQEPADLALSARAYARVRYPPMPALWTGKTRKHEHIRLAYLTAEIGDHPVANLMAGVWERHDRSRFELTCASYGPPTSGPMRERAQAAFDNFLELSAFDEESIARTLFDREIDIAVTLNGYTYLSRPGVLSHRPAPIQVNHLGFPGTMGVPWVDYLIADRRVIAAGEEAEIDEKIVWMPNAYQPTDGGEPRPDMTLSRADFGLPRNAFVFAALNHSYKITPAVFDAWMKILRRVPHGVLWLADKDAEMRDNLRREAQARGVKPERLIFAQRIDGRQAYLARYRLANLFLDTVPYGAHATASDALWAGLPVLTCRGKTFPGRVCADLLITAGMPELVTESLADYESLAVSLANNPGRLTKLAQRIQKDVQASPLFDTARYTRDLETAFETMYAIHQAGGPPRSFAVEAGGQQT